ncbi:hypothetical protein [Bdellovibrio sp. HCB274]|uniref:hypothetical protein n=1 Tax=Bdellovibrio sp. HCB274 TaxID=3394361 RepID=UPI0039B37AFF
MRLILLTLVLGIAQPLFAAEVVLQCKSGTGAKMVEFSFQSDGKALLKYDGRSCELQPVAGRHLPLGAVPHVMIDFDRGSCQEPVLLHGRVKILLGGKNKNQGFLLWKQNSDTSRCEVSKMQNELLIETFKKLKM